MRMIMLCNCPTKRLCILVLAPYLHKFSAVWCKLSSFWCNLRQICIEFGGSLASKFKKIMQKTALSDGAIWDEFSGQN